MKDILEHIKELEKTDKMDYTGYFNGYDIFSDKDLKGDDPEIFIIAGNRTAGKTFFIKRLLVRLFLEYGHQTLIITRKITQTTAVANAFYADLEEDETFKDYTFETDKSGIPYLKGVYITKKGTGERKLFMYIIYINFADNIKEASSVFKKVDIMLKDEFQLEDNSYLPGEIKNIRSIHKSVSRQFNSPVRYVPLILLGNQISIINPYYVTFGIHKRLSAKTKKLRGDGWVLRITFNKIVSQKSSESAFERAFGLDDYSLSSNNNIFMDNVSFIQKMDVSKMDYMFGIGVKGKWFGVWRSPSCYYACRSFDKTKSFNYAIDNESHYPGSRILRPSDDAMRVMKKYFDRGLFYFEDIESKSACIDLFIKTTV